MPYSLQKASEIKKLVDDIGIDATAAKLCMKRESVRRVTRIAKSHARETPATYAKTTSPI